MISNAENSILIFTPYLDSTINKLLSNIEDDIKVVIITSLESDNLFQRGYQLEALKELISNGHTVKNLIGLHAKILLIDNNSISLGSQNFTYRGRKNKEAGFLSNASFFESDFLKDLNDWNNKAQIVSAELIDSLIKYVKDNQDELSILKKSFEEGVNTIIDEFTFDKQDHNITKSKYYNSTFRFAQNEVTIFKELSGINKDYYSFKTPAPNDLSKWIKTCAKGKEETTSITPYDYIPALNSKTMQMAFLRVHSTIITYMKSEFHVSIWNGLYIKEKMFSIDFIFLKTKPKEVNVKITLSGGTLGKATLYYLFNSIEFKLVKTKFSSKDCEKFITENLLNKPRKINAFLLEQIQPRAFVTDQPEEIEIFLPKDSYKVGIMEYKDYPILIFEEY